MSQIRFGARDVAAIRFCVSPIWETVTSLWALADPGRYAHHLPWIGLARSAVARRDVAPHADLLRAFVRPRVWLPDFLTPVPRGPFDTIEEDLRQLRATPADRVRQDIADIDRPRAPAHPLVREVADDPARMLPKVADAVEVWWRVALLPHWPRMRALLEADIAYRARQFTVGGARLLFDTLSPATRWEGDRLVVDHGAGIDIEVAGAGFPLIPSLFFQDTIALSVSPGSEPSAVYPARGVGTLWEPPAGAPGALGRLLGHSRAGLLALVVAPATTKALAALSGLSPGTVSQHLAVLRDAGLVESRRQGREVVYAVTDRGRSLLGDGTERPRPPAGGTGPLGRAD
ncbi:ArsR/SmtB family transcription factor [Longispora urticae]